MDQKIRFGRVLRLAGAFTACAIGSGFATGQEIMQFFTAQGIMSMLGSVVTTVIFAWCGAIFMKHGYEHKLSEPGQILEFYFGRTGGIIAAVLVELFLYSVFVIMISGAGTVLSELFGLPPMLGRLLIAALSLLTVVCGLSKLADIIGGAGAVIIVFTIAVGIIALVAAPGSIPDAAAVIPALPLTKAPGGWLWSSILYPAYNAVVVIFLSCCLGRDAASRKEAVLGGACGGIFFGLAILVMNAGLTANIAAVWESSVPVLALAKNIHPAVAFVFSVIVFLGIYSTAVPMLWSVVRSFAGDRTKRSVILSAVLSAAGLALGMTDFKTLVNTIYPFSGYAGLLIIAAATFRELFKKKITEK